MRLWINDAYDVEFDELCCTRRGKIPCLVRVMEAAWGVNFGVTLRGLEERTEAERDGSRGGVV